MKNSRFRMLLAWGIACVAFAASAGATELVLQNGWTNAPFATSNAEAFTDDGIVYLKGAVAGGSTDVLFTLPPTLRPATNVYVSVDLCFAAQGRLFIQPSGVVTVQGTFSDAQCFTSLDGVRFALPASGFTFLTLDNGWIGFPFGTSSPAVGMIDGIVHLKGALASGTGTALFQLPIGMRPATIVFVPVNLCGGAKGRLIIGTDGVVTVQPQSGNFAEAQCFTSLDGVAFAPSTSGFTPLTLENGWQTFPFGSTDAAVSMIDGIVFFEGAIWSGSSDVLFTLPAAMRPATNVYVPVDLCSAAKGRLIIATSGVVRVDPVGPFSDAQCFTSLDGASFVAPPPSVFTALPLSNSWVHYVGAQTAAVVLYDGIVHFKGALASGASSGLFDLPVTLRPETDVYVSIDLCLASVGRLRIQPSGQVSVGAFGPFSDAQCFTSLEGASFALSSNGFNVIVPLNGWVDGPFSTSGAAAGLVNGIVHLKGAIGSGASGFAFTLPPAMRPATSVYLQIGLCNAAKGRLFINSSGNASVLPASGIFSEAQCFTSLDGVKFAPSTAGFADRTLLNGWSDMPFATSSAAASILHDIVYLKGGIAGGLSADPFTLPPILRPQGVVLVPIDLFGGAKGRLVIQPTGEVSIESPGGLAVAQGFTSLDGASYAVPEPAVVPALVSGVLLLAGIRRSLARWRRAGARFLSRIM